VKIFLIVSVVVPVVAFLVASIVSYLDDRPRYHPEQKEDDEP